MATKTKTQGTGTAKGSELVLARTFDAPRERVWKAWTNPEEMKRWWGPKDSTTVVCRIDLRVGGRYVLCERAPDGKEFWSTGVYREIVPMVRLVSTHSFADPKGNVVPATHYGMGADIPLETLFTVTLEDLDGKTRMTLRHAGLPAGRHRELVGLGWSEVIAKLAVSLAEGPSGTEFVTDRGKLRVVMSRTFNAPRERVFEAYTDPKLIPLWWGPRSETTRVETMDVRKGGRWRYLSRGRDGEEYAFRGEYREVVPPKRLVSTFEFEGMPGRISVDTATFEALGRKTKLTMTSTFEAIEDLEAMLQSGMESGARETWDRLGELVETE